MKKKLVLPLACLAMGCALSVEAQYFDDFNTASDPNWTRWTPRPTATVTFPMLSPGNFGYRLADAPGTASFLTTSRVASYVTGLTATDFTVSADLVNWNGSDEMQFGVMARVQSPISNAGAAPACYALVYINRYSVRTNGTDQLRILRLGPGELTFLNDGLGGQGQFSNPGTNSGFTTPGGSAAPQPGGNYRLFFYGSGYSLIGKIMDLSTGQFMTFNDGTGNFTDFIHATDPNAMFAAGSAGVVTLVNTVTPGVDATFDNFNISQVPEPSSIALAAIGLAGFFLTRRQRRKS